MRFGGKLEIGTLDDGVYGTRLLAESAVDAFGHVYVVSGRPPRTIGTLLSFNCNSLKK